MYSTSRDSCKARRNGQTPSHNPHNQLKVNAKETAPSFKPVRFRAEPTKGATQISESIVIKIHIPIESVVTIEMPIPEHIRFLLRFVLLVQDDRAGSSRARGRLRRRLGGGR